MTDRVSTLTIVLSQDMRTDDVEAVMAALYQNKYVAEVLKGEPVNVDHYVNRARLRQELLTEIVALFRDK